MQMGLGNRVVGLKINVGHMFPLGLKFDSRLINGPK